MTKAHTELAADTTAVYLRERGLIPAGKEPVIEPLDGGVSNTVLAVTWDANCLVLKQPLPNLAVPADWPADVTRVHNEAEAIRAFRRILHDADFDTVTVPHVQLEDEHNHVIGIECAPNGAKSWKAELLAGRIDQTIARTLGRALGVVHDRTAADAALRITFDDSTPFDQLRLDPYHRTIAERHPDIAGTVLAEVDRIAAVDLTLVHGDYSPKNVLVNRTDGEPMTWLIDFEVAHWGDPAFDVAFMTNHLFIKALCVTDHREELLKAAQTFWDAYRQEVSWDLEEAVVAELGVLILARIDGKSPVEYVEAGPVADAMRHIGLRTLQDEIQTVEDYVALVRTEAP